MNISFNILMMYRSKAQVRQPEETNRTKCLY